MIHQQEIRGFRAQLRVLERAIAFSMQDQADCCGVTTAQCHALLELEGLGCVNLTSLADLLGLDKSTLSRTIDGLVQLSLVSRSDDPKNRRQQIICLSDRGKSRVESIHAQCDAAYTEMLNKLPVSSRKALLKLMPEFVQVISSQSCCSSITKDKK